ncbi:hypothetical protein GCM10010214_16590 [Streptomyces abikoensis]|nr:hypothetical protein GCM10010214_16590 [Streptomyces abikoensis]
MCGEEAREAAADDDGVPPGPALVLTRAWSAFGALCCHVDTPFVPSSEPENAAITVPAGRVGRDRGRSAAPQ